MSPLPQESAGRVRCKENGYFSMFCCVPGYARLSRLWFMDPAAPLEGEQHQVLRFYRRGRRGNWLMVNLIFACSDNLFNSISKGGKYLCDSPRWCPSRAGRGKPGDTAVLVWGPGPPRACRFLPHRTFSRHQKCEASVGKRATTKKDSSLWPKTPLWITHNYVKRLTGFSCRNESYFMT